MAVEAGATQVQGTINGYGERCGNANLISIIPALKLKMGLDCVSDRRLAELTETSHYRGRGGQCQPRDASALRGRERLCAQGRPARQRGAA